MCYILFDDNKIIYLEAGHEALKVLFKKEWQVTTVNLIISLTKFKLIFENN